MFIHVIRGLFLLGLLAIGLSYVTGGMGEDAALISDEADIIALNKPLVILGALGLGILIIAIDLLIPRKSLASISGLFLGLLAGLLIAFVFSLVIDLVVNTFPSKLREQVSIEVQVDGTIERRIVDREKPMVSAIKLLVGAICCYLPISFIFQTKDDIRFIIPYVEFNRQTKGGRPLILDTSAIIDARIADIAKTRVFDQPLLIPRFVLHELQQVADSADRTKRNRGRRGLDVLNQLQHLEHLDVTIYESPRENTPVDQRLVALAKELDGKVVTTDYNLNKVAKIHGVPVVNVNDLANALKAVVLPGETLTIKIIKPGEEPGQGIGYIEDGTMVVVEGTRNKIGQTVDLTVTSALQTSAGRMIFGKCQMQANENSRGNTRRRSDT